MKNKQLKNKSMSNKTILKWIVSLFIVSGLFSIVIMFQFKHKAEHTLNNITKKLKDSNQLISYDPANCNFGLDMKCQIKNLELIGGWSISEINLLNIKEFAKLEDFVLSKTDKLDLKLIAKNVHKKSNSEILGFDNVEIKLNAKDEDLFVKLNILNKSLLIDLDLTGAIGRKDLKNIIYNGEIDDDFDILSILYLLEANSTINYEDNHLFNSLYLIYHDYLSKLSPSEISEFHFSKLMYISDEILSKEDLKQKIQLILDYQIKDKDLDLILAGENIIIEDGIYNTLNELLNKEENNKKVTFKTNSKLNILKSMEEKNYTLNISN